jgi:LPS-assembly protein
VDDFSNLLRFDARDILSDTNELEYGIVNRLYAKKKVPGQPNCTPPAEPNPPAPNNAEIPAWQQQKTEPAPSAQPPAQPCLSGTPARELIRWELAQKYFFDPTFGHALVAGRRNVFTTTADFTAIAFVTGPRNMSPLISRLRFDPTAHIEGGWDLDYDFQTGRINSSTAFINFHYGPIGFGGSDAFLQAPGEVLVSNNLPTSTRLHQVRATVTYGGPNKRGISGASTLGFDENLGFLQYLAAQTTYNWDCCGVTVEFRRFALGSVRNENQYKFTFSLANIGSFGNLRRQDRLF